MENTKEEVAPATTMTEDSARQFAKRCHEWNNEVFLAIAEHRTAEGIEACNQLLLLLSEWRNAEQGQRPLPEVSLDEVARMLRGLS